MPPPKVRPQKEGCVSGRDSLGRARLSLPVLQVLFWSVLCVCGLVPVSGLWNRLRKLQPARKRGREWFMNLVRGNTVLQTCHIYKYVIDQFLPVDCTKKVWKNPGMSDPLKLPSHIIWSQVYHQLGFFYPSWLLRHLYVHCCHHYVLLLPLICTGVVWSLSIRSYLLC